MGKYDDAYKSYYNRINNKNNKIPEKKVALNIEMEEEFLIRKSKNRKGNFDNYINIIVMTTVIPVVMFTGIVGMKYLLGEVGKQIYNHVKRAVSTDLLYKKYVLNFIDTFDMDTLLKKETLSDLGVEMPKLKADEIATDVSNTNSDIDKEIESFNLDDNSINFAKSDARYKDVLKSLNGNKIKAKSEEGIVLSCSYKIIVSHIGGVIENIGENAGGHYISIKYDNGIISNYYNLPEINFKKGSSIKKGDKIADIKEERDIIFKIKQDDKFVHPRMYLDFLE
ncbi:MAG: M23 family metallopeptidase [Sarcina sp.]